MKHHLKCPECGSPRVRLSRKQGVSQRLRALFGVHRFRCSHCGKRFEDRAWRFEFVWYAKCPRCAGLELRDWEEKYYYPPAFKRMLAYLGAQKQRCEACRYNFITFRPRWQGKKENGSK